MKISVSLPQADIEFLDSYAHDSGSNSRSGALQDAVRLLRSVALANDYAQAWSEWEASGDADAWDRLSGDGLVDDARRLDAPR